MSRGLTGLWVLDEVSSDPPTSHLSTLGLGDLAQSAATKINATVSLRLTVRGSEAVITHLSSLGEKDRRLVFGEPTHETGRDGTQIRHVAELVSSSKMRTHIDYGKARIVETKTLVEPDRMLQEITMVLKGNTTKSARTFIRTSPEAVAAALAAAKAAAGGGTLEL